MQKGRQIVAWWLLVLLVRVLTPEAAVLRLHRHQHTDDKPQVSYSAKPGTKAALSPQHQHCHVEQLFNAPFQPAVPVAVPAPVRLLTYATYRPQAPVCRASHLLDGASLRGPPARRA
ncbi:hypothetical protein [Hymenobacter cellulosilyticus]|uniref:Uncharacterized protein n=1 Tax=Hymenobacter cellulosilyticus TaxID=2932248 RepID=A0A8T9Q2Z1_9BACT|nr:hypothetical protein [Hymenobacter cellulosilyticus]UOQ70228.1 hypothetical protein MUN79_15850 [Hymenobacter cellulosilyticus]